MNINSVAKWKEKVHSKGGDLLPKYKCKLKVHIFIVHHIRQDMENMPFHYSRNTLVSGNWMGCCAQQKSPLVDFKGRFGHDIPE